MAQSVMILLPVFPKDITIIYFKGYVQISKQCTIIIYITSYSPNKNLLKENKHETEDAIYGCSGPYQSKKKLRYPSYLFINQQSVPLILQLIINKKSIDPKSNCIIMLYNYDKIRDSQVISNSDNHLCELQSLIQSECRLLTNKNTSELKCNYSNWLSFSMCLQYIFNYYNLIHWLITSIKEDKKISIRQGNLILAIVIDLFLGYVLLQLLSQDMTDFSSLVMGILETLINLLHSSLKWIMGSPAGLKLNNAFNNMLGKYFTYHVQLWWLFLDVSGEKLDNIFQIYHYIGYLGLTFQIAVISDMICIATFHSYCIYVYAARLFNIQISGLIALSRLFVGRKYNPLRETIDSCEYTNQELFVGTVAFTILLLLLPTTAMYYIVFTLFRVLSLIVQYAMAKLIHIVQTLPIYVSFLWLVHSPKVAGNILVEVIDSEEFSPLVLKIKLFNKPIYELVNNFKPPVCTLKQFEWTNLLSNIFIGKQIV